MRVVRATLVLEVVHVEVGEAVVHVVGQRPVRTVRVDVHQLGHEVRRPANDESLMTRNELLDIRDLVTTESGTR